MDEKRRTLLLRGATAAWVTSLGYPVYAYLESGEEERPDDDRSVTLAKVADTLAAGSAMVFQVGNQVGLLIHHPGDEWIAFSAFCTHLSCPVSYQPEQDRIFCPCHEGVFDPHTGANLAGPPPRPLPRWKVDVKGSDVIVTTT